MATTKPPDLRRKSRAPAQFKPERPDRVSIHAEYADGIPGSRSSRRRAKTPGGSQRAASGRLGTARWRRRRLFAAKHDLVVLPGHGKDAGIVHTNCILKSNSGLASFGSLESLLLLELQLVGFWSGQCTRREQYGADGWHAMSSSCSHWLITWR